MLKLPDLKTTNSLKGTVRLFQTGRILLETGISWALGNRPPSPRLLRETFEKLGTTYIKLGQFIASSPSIFPDSYVEEFQRCLDNTPPTPFRVIEKTLRKELNNSVNQIFREIDPTPLASASIAQVHAARLATGEDVVIKVQKPGVRNILLTDLNFLYGSAKILELLVPRLSMASLSDIVAEMQKSMLAECDFYQEAENLREFQQFLVQSGIEGVVVPEVYSHASSLRVLTMERLYGVPFTDIKQVQQYACDPQQSLLTAMNAWLSSLLMGKSFHADVHAGNLMMLKNGKIGFIDFGIVGRIQPRTWSAITDFMQAIANNDFSRMAKAMVGIGVTRQQVNVPALAADIEKLYQAMDRLQTNISLDVLLQENELNKTMMQIISLGKQYGIHFPREFALLLKQILYFDRYLQILAPDVDFFTDERLTGFTGNLSFQP